MYRWLGAYEDWIYAVAAVWFFDRLARAVRIVAVGPRRAKLTEIGEGYIRMDVPGIRWRSEAGRHAYLYFPTLHPYKPWQNNPFSIMPTAMLQPLSVRPQADNESESSQSASGDFEKPHGPRAVVHAIKRSPSTAGLTMYVRKSGDMTRALRAKDDLLVLIEGPYPNNSIKEVLCCDRLLLICGGIGVTAVLPFVNHHWNVKLAWSIKYEGQCLVDDLECVLNRIDDKQVAVGSRLSVEQLISTEMDYGYERVGVVVAGPGSMCDDVREAVVAASKTGGKTAFELMVEAYSW